jgi:hypothetical protein
MQWRLAASPQAPLPSPLGTLLEGLVGARLLLGALWRVWDLYLPARLKVLLESNNGGYKNGKTFAIFTSTRLVRFMESPMIVLQPVLPRFLRRTQ